jgi:hypothetical protein
MYTGEEPLGVKAQQGESLNLCHSSKGPWLEVSVKCYLFRTSTKRDHRSRREVSQDERSRRSWIVDKVETEVSTLLSTGINSPTPQGLLSFVTTTTSPVMT